MSPEDDQVGKPYVIDNAKLTVGASSQYSFVYLLNCASITIGGAEYAHFLCKVFVDLSAWFEFTPLPDEQYEFKFKPEHSQRVEQLLRGFEEEKFEEEEGE